MSGQRSLLITLTGAVLLSLALLAGHSQAQSSPDLEARKAMSGAGTRLLSALQGTSSGAPAAEPQAPTAGPALFGGGANVVVNDPAAETDVQNETTLAVLGNTICAGYNDLVFGGYSGLSRSADLGASWNEQGGLGQYGDPAVAVHEATGTFYYAELAMIGGLSAIGVAESGDDCQSFSTAVNASPGYNAQDFQDKPWIAVDNSGGASDGNIYVCWARFVDGVSNPPGTDSEIVVSRSIDGGATFTDEQVVSLPTDFFAFGCHIDVGPNGQVYVAWSDRGGDFPIRFRRSLDAGLTWQTATKVNLLPIRHAGIDRIVTCGDILRFTLNGDIRTLAGAWMAVDTTGGPYNGRIYVAWQSDPAGATDNSDVYLTSSIDGGLTWAPEEQLGGGTVTDQFQPFVEVAGTGAVSVAWYDRRNDPSNNLDIDVYTAISSNGGATVDPLVRVTDASFPTYIPYSCYMGDYIAVAGDASSFHYAWGDNRNAGDPDVYFDSLSAPPLKDAAADYDGDTVANGSDSDDDNDGCSDTRELGPNQIQGGQRDPNFFWDLYDTPPRDQAVNVGDISRVVGRFGSSGTATTIADALAPPPAPPAYHAGFDRTLRGPNAWNSGRANGSITIADISRAVAQFGHNCL